MTSALTLPTRHAALAALLFFCAAANAADNTELFAPFANLLQSHVHDDQIDYPAFARADEFAALISKLARTTPGKRASNERELAFYINAYNALTVQGIVDGYSPASIWSRLRFFRRRQFELANTEMSLYELQTKRIASAGDPRVHFAIVCACTSCPTLASELYTEDELDQQLNRRASEFINNPNNNSFDRERREAKLSRIFSWHENDFVASAGSLPAYLAEFVADPELAASLRDDVWTIRFNDFDWSLNGPAP